MPTVTSTEKLISRKEAADILGVSVRTIDRYIDKKLIRCKVENRSKLLYRKEIEKLINKKNAPAKPKKQPEYFEPSAESEEADEVITHDDKAEALIADSSIFNFEEQKESSVYKELYLDTKTELQENQKRLENANYRLGQLESQLKNTVPMIELTRKEREVEKITLDHQEQAQVLTRDLQREKFFKMILLGGLLTILLAEPVIVALQHFFPQLWG